MTAPGALRITGGEHRGRRIGLPRAHDFRPTSEKARQAYFDIIGPSIQDARFLDLFAGTGIFAMEALSRGAAEAVAVESYRKAAEQIRNTASTIGLALTVLSADVYRSAGAIEEKGPFDLVYADPPYGDVRWGDLLEIVARVISDSAIVAIEHWVANAGELPEALHGLVRYRTARYGTVAISLYERTQS